MAKLALRYGLNANMLFKWRREYRAGKFGVQSSGCQPPETPLFLPIVTSASPSRAKPAKLPNKEPGYIEILRGDSRIRVCGEVTASALHQVLQLTFNWGNYHLHEFDFGGERFGIPDPEFDWEPVRSEKRVQLKTALGGMATFKYIYDFGDHWEHRIKVERVLPGDPELSDRVMLLKGANAAPPEDVGGAPGYEDFVAAMTDPNHPEHQAMRNWHGDSFDPTFVDVVAISLALHDLKI